MNPKDPTRRSFLAGLGAVALAPASGCLSQDSRPGDAGASRPASAPAGGDEAPLPPGIDVAAIAAAERFAALEFTPKERQQMLEVVGEPIATYPKIRAARLRNEEAPAEVFAPIEGAARAGAPAAEPYEPAAGEAPPFPKDPGDVAFAPIATQGAWLRSGAITSEALTRLSLERLRRHDPTLRCVVTLAEERALAQARRADEELRAGKARGPLHGIPYGLKDLFDTRGIRTTYGAEPWRERVPDEDAAVVKRLEAAGAVLVAKLSLGALAYGDRWFGGITKNPFDPRQGSSGSSAGSASAAAAGLVGFALGTETWGSIASPCSRCGATGFRPTFGLVPRTGAMALCWSLDKAGPIARTAADCALVLRSIAGRDPLDPASVDRPAAALSARPFEGLRVGFLRAEFEGGRRRNADDARVLEAFETLGVLLAPLELARGPYAEVINLLIAVEAAAAFDEMTRSNEDDQLSWQANEAWPNLFRAARLVPAVEHTQARRLRRRFMQQMLDLLAEVDVLIAPSAHGDLHALTNMTGHPALTIRQGFREAGTPRAITLWGRPFEDATLLRLGAALEETLGIWQRRPKLG